MLLKRLVKSRYYRFVIKAYNLKLTYSVKASSSKLKLFLPRHSKHSPKRYILLDKVGIQPCPYLFSGSVLTSLRLTADRDFPILLLHGNATYKLYRENSI